MPDKNYWTNQQLDSRWDQAANWDQARIPVSTDDAIIEGSRCNNAPIIGGTFGGPNSVRLEDYGGSFGLPGNPVQFQTTDVSEFVVSTSEKGPATGQVFLGTTGGARVVEVAVLSRNQNDNAMELSGIFNSIQAVRGACRLLNGCVVNDAVNIGFSRVSETDVKMIIDSGVTLATIVQDGGQLSSKSSCTTWLQNSGQAIFTLGSISSVLHMGGGRLRFQSEGGTIPQGAVIMGGVLDFTGSVARRTVQSGVPMTITSRGEVNVMIADPTVVDFQTTPVLVGDSAKLESTGNVIQYKKWQAA